MEIKVTKPETPFVLGAVYADGYDHYLLTTVSIGSKTYWLLVALTGGNGGNGGRVYTYETESSVKNVVHNMTYHAPNTLKLSIEGAK